MGHVAALQLLKMMQDILAGSKGTPTAFYLQVFQVCQGGHAAHIFNMHIQKGHLANYKRCQPS